MGEGGLVPLDGVVVVPPPRLLGVLVTSLDVEGVVRGPLLLLGGGQHGDDGEADGLHGERGAPVVREDGQADVAVAVDVWVHRDVVPDEDDLGRVEGVLGAELEAQCEHLAGVQRVRRAVHLHAPAGKIGTSSQGIRR